jgi:outer membrane lipoprotein SlyB
VATAPPARPAICTNCGSVEAINTIEQQGEGSGLGAIAGGVAGALLGNQVGRGTGRKVATVAGAAGGAYAGHQVEKHVKSSKSYEVVVRMEDGGSRRFPYESQPAFRVGDRVKVVEGALVAN